MKVITTMTSCARRGIDMLDHRHYYLPPEQTVSSFYIGVTQQLLTSRVPPHSTVVNGQ
jgi:hypothetical protein